MLAGPVAVLDGEFVGVSVKTKSGVTLGTGFINSTWRVEISSQAIGVPRSEKVSKINPRSMRGIIATEGSAE